MTKRISNLNKSRQSSNANALGTLKAAVWGGGASAELLETRQMLSTSWFVSPDGSDKNPGTLAQPFQTIQAAADVAQAGDHVEIEAGTYRETVIPAHSGTLADPIVYEAYDGQIVTISGADILTGWTNDTGSIYQAPMPEDLGEGNNEVFVDGQEVNEARYPNTSLDLSNQTMATMQSVTLGTNSVTIYDSALNQPANYWTGAIIHMTPGQQWEAQTGTVTASSPGQITISYSPGNSYELPQAGNPFYLTGTFKALNSPGEWYRDPTSGMVYLWTPGGDDPSDHLIEVKARADAFNLDGRANITIRDVNIFAATIATDAGSTQVVMDGLNVQYTSQFLTLVRGWEVPYDAGIMLRGADDLLENSVVAYSPGDGVYMSGAGSRVTNTIVHDVDTDGGDAAGIRDLAPNSEIDHDTIYNTGRDGILHEAAGLNILYNTIFNFGQLTTDSGGIYTVRTDGGGTVIAYNTVYGAHSGGYGETALYLDNNSSNYIVHDNKTSDVDTALKLNFSSENETIYNNTLDATQHSVFGNFGGDWNGTTFTDNVFSTSPQFGSGAVLTGNASAASAGKGAGTFVSGASLTPPGTGSGGSSNGGSSGSGSGSTSSGSGSGSTGAGSGSGSTGTGSSSGSSGGTGSTTTGGSSGSTGAGSGSGSTGTGSSSGSSGGAGSTTTGSGSSSSGAGSSSGSTGTGSGSGSTGTGSGSGSTGTSGSSSTGSGSGSGTTGTGAATGTGTGSTGTGSTTSGTTASGGASSGSGDGGGASTGTTTSSGNQSGSSNPPTSTANPGAGDGSTTGSGSGDGTTTTSGPAGGSAMPVNPPAPPSTPPQVGSQPGEPAASPGVSEIRTAVKADRAELKNVRRQHRSELRKLAKIRQANIAALNAVRQHLVDASQAPRRVGASSGQANHLAALRLQLQQLRETIKADNLALKAAHNTSFAIAAEEKLASDISALHAALKAGRNRTAA